MEIFLYIYWTSAIIYILFVFFCWIGWRRAHVQKSIAYNPSTSVSVIIPARNEEQNILNCLEDLAEQDYPAAMFEVIVVDDDSTDKTAELTDEFIQVNADKTFVLAKLKEKKPSQTFKKLAVTKGIEMARGQLIITTDADCRLFPKWISSIVQHYETSKSALISGPVCFHNENTLLEKIQSLEFMGLVGIGAGSMNNGIYMLCNGANLAYSKKVFHDVHGFEANDNAASGDDTQLLLKISSKGNKKISFLKAREAIVYTSAKSSLSELIHQRKRWASKIPRQSSMYTVFIAASAYLFHAGIIVSAILMIIKMQFIWLLVLPFAVKCAIEFMFLFDLSRFFKREKLLSLFLPAQIIYPFYIVIIGAIAPFGSYLWKERKVK